MTSFFNQVNRYISVQISQSRTSWRDRVDAGQLGTTDLSLRTSWNQKCHKNKNLICSCISKAHQ